MNIAWHRMPQAQHVRVVRCVTYPLQMVVKFSVLANEHHADGGAHVYLRVDAELLGDLLVLRIVDHKRLTHLVSDRLKVLVQVAAVGAWHLALPSLAPRLVGRGLLRWPRTAAR